MNILYLCDEYPPGRHGGIGTEVQLLAREMVKLGHNIVVAGFYDWGYQGVNYFEDNGVKVYRFRRRLSHRIFKNQDSILTRGIIKILKNLGVFHSDIKISLKKYGEFLETLIKDNHIDLIEIPDYNDYMRFCKSYIPFPVLSKPFIVKLHGSIVYYAREANRTVQNYIWQMEHDMLQRARAVISVSRYTADKTAGYLNYKKNISVIYNGICINESSTEIIKNTQRVVFTGTLVKKKGIFQLAKAWNIVNEQMPSARLLVIGKGKINGIKKILTPEAESTVIFKGHISRKDVIDYLSTSAIAVFPSYSESFGLAPVESMMCGTATIFTSSASGPEIIKDGEEGLLVNPENEKEIAEKILFLLKNPEIADIFAKNGREKASKFFNIKVIAKQHEEYYQGIKNSNSGS